MLHEALENCRRGLLSKISKAMILLAIHVSIQDNCQHRFFGHLTIFNLPNDLDLKKPWKWYAHVYENTNAILHIQS
jgi:hypothetical protein